MITKEKLLSLDVEKGQGTQTIRPQFHHKERNRSVDSTTSRISDNQQSVVSEESSSMQSIVSSVNDSVRRRRKLVIAFGLFFLLYTIAVSIPTRPTTPNTISVYFGGTISIISSGFVLLMIPIGENGGDTVLKKDKSYTLKSLSKLLVSRLYDIFTFPIRDAKPPIALFYWRAVCDLLLGIRFVADQNPNPSIGDIRSSAAFLEFAEISSELWFLCAGVELVLSIMRPFDSFKSRLFYYHLFVWIPAIIMAAVVGKVPGVAGIFIPGSQGTNGDDDINDVNSQTVFSAAYLYNQAQDTYIDHQKGNFTLSSLAGDGLFWIPAEVKYWAPWIFLYVEIIIILPVAIYSIYFGFVRFNSGAAITIRHRLNTIVLNFVNIQWNALYWLALSFFFFLTTVVGKPHPNDDVHIGCTNDFIVKTVFFLISSKGFTNLVVWLIVGNIRQSLLENSNEEIDINVAMRAEILKFAVKGIEHCVVAKEFAQLDPLRDRQLRIIVQDNYTADILTPFLNENWIFLKLMFGADSLISKIIHQREESRESLIRDSQDNRSSKTVTQAAIFRIRNTDDRDTSTSSVDPENVGYVDLRSTHYSTFSRKYCPQLFTNLTKGFDPPLFTEYEPCYFRNIRAVSGVDGEEYYKSFLTPLKAVLNQSGGASNALFFYSAEERFLAKSITAEYRDLIIKKARAYSDYLGTNVKSFICRIYGVYTLTIYGFQFNFIVMQNLLPKTVSEIYDIKGSWVNRATTKRDKPIDARKYTCQHCNQPFVHNSHRNREILTEASKNKSSSSTTVRISDHKLALSLVSADRCKVSKNSIHEPILTLKDNDLKFKLGIREDQAEEIFDQMRSDADFLCNELQVMDYSLLIGCQKALFQNVPIQDLSRPPSDPSRLTLSISRTPEKQISFATSNISGSRHPSLTSSSDIQGYEVTKLIAPHTYTFGIIDYFQQWTLQKQIERFWKVHILRKDARGVSCVETGWYHDRFLKSLRDILDIKQDEGDEEDEDES